MIMIFAAVYLVVVWVTLPLEFDLIISDQRIRIDVNNSKKSYVLNTIPVLCILPCTTVSFYEILDFFY